MKFAHDRLLRNMGWMGLSELMSRLSRLVTAVILARSLGVSDYGVVAIAVTTAELVNVLTRNGIGAHIVQASDEQLDAVCNQAYRLNRQFCLWLCLIQCMLAWPVARFYAAPELAPLIAVLALSYLVYPYAMVQVYRAQRANRMRLTGLATGGQVTLDNLLCAALAWQGFGLWSVVLPKLLVAPLWVVLFRRAEPWRPGAGYTKLRVSSDMLSFSGQILATEIIKMLRNNLDKLLIGRILGLEALGLYYFAVNAGIGLSLSLVTAFNTAVYPHLCVLRSSARDFWRGYLRSLRLVGVIGLIALGLQCLAAPWYVPLVFGAQWLQSVPLLMLLILSAIPRPLAETAGQMLRAANRTGLDLRWNLALTLLYCAGLLLALPHGLYAIGMATFAVYLIAVPAYLTWLHRRFNPYRLNLVLQGVMS